MSRLVIEPHYLGSIEYFVLLSQYDEVCFEIYESFPKQTYRNRAYFLTSNKVQSLIVPVNYSNGATTNKVKVDYSQRWIKDHWGAFYSAYGKAPFFEFFSEEFKAIWDKRLERLVDLNVAFMKVIFNILQMSIKVSFTSEYSNQLEHDFRGLISPKRSFADRNIYAPSTYTQLFGEAFVPNLSMVDLIMCEGPNAVSVLNRSRVLGCR